MDDPKRKASFVFWRGWRLPVAVLAAAVLIGIGLILGLNRQPSYQGLNLGQWIVLHRNQSSMEVALLAQTPPFRGSAAVNPETGLPVPLTTDLSRRVTNALVKMKPKAIPVLLKWTAYEQPPWQKFICRQLPFVLRYSWGRRLCEDRRDAIGQVGLDGFQILGPEAAGAVPKLLKRCGTAAWSKNPGAALRAWNAIQATGEEGAVVLAQIARDARSPDRATALDLLANAGSWTSLNRAAPIFVECLSDKDVAIAVRTAEVFRTWGHRLPEMLPRVVEAMHDARPSVRQAAAEALGQALTSYRAGVPSLLPPLLAALNDPDQEVRLTATNAIRLIGPAFLPGASGQQ